MRPAPPRRLAIFFSGSRAIWGAVMCAALFGVLGYGCGRTSLDDGFGADNSGAGAGGVTGSGGTRGLGGSGAGGATSIACGASTCRLGSQICCTQAGAGQLVQSCVAANNPSACPAGISATCGDASSCPANQVCCLSVLTQSISCTAAAQCAGLGDALFCASNSGCPANRPICCKLPTTSLGLCAPTPASCPL